ncbi:MAG: hypothetical protein M3O31_15735 [Acidobacteriota bacterium]|nr:hypothetical protein [Acidobacteriota bacterium]
MAKLNDHIVSHKLAKDLGLPASADPVGQIVRFCRGRVRVLIADFDGPKTPEAILGWLESKLRTRFIEIHQDADLRQTIRDYVNRGEAIFKLLDNEFQSDTEGITLRLSYRELWEPEFVSVVDCRRRRKLRRYHTKWHELAHLLILTDQSRMAFRRTHNPHEEKSVEEKIVDAIAGELSFFEEFVGPLAEGEISFEKIDKLRLEMCPDSSHHSAALNISKQWPTPCIWLKAELAMKKRPSPGESPELRATEVSQSPAAREIGFSVIRQFRVPPQSVIHKVFYGDVDMDEAGEDLSWWESSSGTCLPNRPVSIQARKMGSVVHALMTLRDDANDRIRRRIA